MVDIKMEYGTWCRVTWYETLPGLNILGLQLTRPSVRQHRVNVVRLYPKHVGLDSAEATPEKVMQMALKEGYQPLPDKAIEEIIQGARSRRRGYIVAPTVSGERLLLVWTGGAIQEVGKPLFPTYQDNGQTWSVIMCKPG